MISHRQKLFLIVKVWLFWFCIVFVSSEIFTIGGNAFGSPCQFPFTFMEKWYAECTKDGRSDGQLWCATERDYNKSRKWGFCPTQSKSMLLPTLQMATVNSTRTVMILQRSQRQKQTCHSLPNPSLSAITGEVSADRSAFWPHTSSTVGETTSFHELSTQHCPCFPLLTDPSFPWHHFETGPGKGQEKKASSTVDFLNITHNEIARRGFLKQI